MNTHRDDSVATGVAWGAAGFLQPSGMSLGARPRAGIHVSLLLHGLALVAILGAPLLVPHEMPEPTGFRPILVFNPAPPLPRPLPLGGPGRPSDVLSATPPTPTAPAQREDAFVAPIVTEVIEPAPDGAAPGLENEGVPDGSLLGQPEGMPNGVDDGQLGGVPWGKRHGVLFGDGDDEMPVERVDQGPMLIRQVRPTYPHDAFIKKVSGTVVLEIVIGSDGSVRRTKVIQSIPGLDQAARECVLKWRFKAARKAGRPVASLALTPVRFTLY